MKRRDEYEDKMVDAEGTSYALLLICDEGYL